MRRLRKDIKTDWKQKIDPVFDKLVKSYVDFLSPFEKSPREGRLNFPDDFIEPIIKTSDLHDAHETDKESLDVMFNFLEKVGMASKKDLKIIHAFYSSKNADDILKICPEMIATLPEEESRQFYNDKLELYKNHPELKPDSEILDKNTIDFYSVVMSLLIRYLFVKLYAGKEIDDNEAEKFLKKSNVIMPIVGAILSRNNQSIRARDVVTHFGYSPGTARSYLSYLSRHGLLERTGRGYALTDKGKERLEYFDAVGCNSFDCPLCIEKKANHFICPECGHEIPKKEAMIQSEKDFLFAVRHAGVYCPECEAQIFDEKKALLLGIQKENKK